MKEVVDELKEIIGTYSHRFSAIPDEVFSEKPVPTKWSKKEVLGHLIDSAQNNLRRFICGQYESHPPLISYHQDFWVAANEYQRMDKKDVVQLWKLLNLRICAVLDNMPQSNYERLCNSGNADHTLKWLAEDYVKHMKHHINQIVSGSFNVVYK